MGQSLISIKTVGRFYEGIAEKFAKNSLKTFFVREQ